MGCCCAGFSEERATTTTTSGRVEFVKNSTRPLTSLCIPCPSLGLARYGQPNNICTWWTVNYQCCCSKLNSQKCSAAGHWPAGRRNYRPGPKADCGCVAVAVAAPTCWPPQGGLRTVLQLCCYNATRAGTNYNYSELLVINKQIDFAVWRLLLFMLLQQEVALADNLSRCWFAPHASQQPASRNGSQWPEPEFRRRSIGSRTEK